MIGALELGVQLGILGAEAAAPVLERLRRSPAAAIEVELLASWLGVDRATMEDLQRRAGSGSHVPSGVRDLARDVFAASATQLRGTPPEDSRFGETLVREGVLKPEQVHAALQAQETTRRQGMALRLGEILVNQGLLTPEQVRQFLHLAGKQVLHCTKCGKNFNVKHARPGLEVFCPHCSVALSPPSSPRTINAHATKVIPPRANEEEKAAGGRPFGRYRLLEKLGQGGMGVVWKAWDTQLKRVVALKQILTKEGVDGEQIERFMREAQLAAKLRHPNIIAVHDVGVHEGQHYFTCEYVEGRSLEEAMKGRVPPKQLLSWVKDVAQALAYAHEQGVVHRDVKPANVLVDGHGKPYVMDFGLAKDVDLSTKEGARRATLTAAGAVMGTPMFMSPEQASGRTHALGPATDQFSLGVMLYQMLTGRLPFAGRSLGELFIEIMHKEPTPPSKTNSRVHRDVETICMKALEKDPGKRYRSMSDLGIDLGRYLDGEPILARPISMAERLWRKARKRKAVLLSTAAAVAIGVVALGWSIHTSLRSSRDFSAAMASARRAEASAEDAEGDDAGRFYATARDAYQEAMTVKRGDLDAKAGYDRIVAVLEELSSTRQGDLRHAKTREKESLAQAALEQSERQKAEQAKEASEEAQGLLEKARTSLAAAARYLYRKDADYEGILGRVEAPRKQIQEALAKAPDAAQGHFLLGRAWSLCWEDEKAEACFRKAIALDPRFSPAHCELGRILVVRAYFLSLGRLGEQGGAWATAAIDAAISSIVRGGEQGGTRPTFLQDLVQQAAMEFEAASHGSEYEDELHRDIAAVMALYAQANSAGMWNTARSAVERSGMVEGSEELHWLAGVAAGAAGSDRDIESFDKAIEIRPRYPYALLSRARAREKRGDNKGAMADLDAAIEVYPRLFWALWVRGGLRFRLDDLAGAIADLDVAVEIRPGDPHILLSRGTVRDRKGDLEGAIADFNAALEAEPALAMALSRRGLAHARRGDLDRAIDDVDAAIRLDPKNAETLLNRATVRFGLHDFDGIIADCGAALEIDPNCVGALYYRSLARAEKGDLEGALADAEKAVEMDPGDAEGYYFRARAREGKGNLAGAAADYRRALDLAKPGWDLRADAESALRTTDTKLAAREEPKDEGGFVKRGEERLAVGDWDGALSDFEAALKKKKRLPAALSGRAAARLGKGDLDGALDDARQSLKADAKDLRALVVLGRAHVAKGLLDDGIGYFERALKLSPEDEGAVAGRDGAQRTRDGVKAAVRRAEQCMKQADRDGAFAALDQAVAINLPYTASLLKGSSVPFVKALVERAESRRGIRRFTGPDASEQRAEADKAGPPVEDFAGAMRDLDLALALEPGSSIAHFERALIQIQFDRIDGAITDLDAALKGALDAAPPDGDALSREAALGFSDTDSGGYQPTRTQVYMRRADLRRRKGDLDAAIADYTDAAREKGDYLWNALLQRGLTRDAKGDSSGALQDYDGALRQKGAGLWINNPSMSAAKARMHHLRGDPAQAIPEYEKSLAMALPKEWVRKHVEVWLKEARDGGNPARSPAGAASNQPAQGQGAFRIRSARASLMDALESCPDESGRRNSVKPPEPGTTFLVVDFEVEASEFQRGPAKDFGVTISGRADAVIEVAVLETACASLRDKRGNCYVVFTSGSADGWLQTVIGGPGLALRELIFKDSPTTRLGVAFLVPVGSKVEDFTFELGDYDKRPLK